ncbi:hypothetical protein [Hymenobacter latericus]|uniref:hypothetical protein n=1 Tax=Hymenobacter sp. YIM 151858-1 TaxID=2987688 RepID=UPI002227E989|nr:hypothetical protein [Hymenobacter sp. YIM 151858-1]UYZ57628.1 hypothetical protein OIS50_11160 [Hymenobacter sp. YIM 151858-1]
MKKTLLLALAAAAFSFASCTHNENSAEQRTVQDNTDGTAEGAQPAPGTTADQSGDGPASIEGTDQTTTNNGSSIYGGPTSRASTPGGATSTTGRTATTTSGSATSGSTAAGSATGTGSGTTAGTTTAGSGAATTAQ